MTCPGSRHQQPIGPTDLLAMGDARLSCDGEIPGSSQTDCALCAFHGHSRKCRLGPGSWPPLRSRRLPLRGLASLRSRWQ
jgi:hypothetical protein